MRIEDLGLDITNGRIPWLQAGRSVDPFDGGKAALLAGATPLHPGQPQFGAGTPCKPRVRVLDQAQQVSNRLGPLLRLTKPA
ncbi:hypothetical protein D3C84_1202360 [compost metagenome]